MDYKNMPAGSRVWIYQANREISENELITIKQRATDFINGWTAHGSLLDAAVEVFYSRFIVLFVNEQQAIASGCGIDKSVHFIRELEKELSLSLLDRMSVAYRNGDKIEATSLPAFEQLLKTKSLNEKTIVFNNMVNTKGDFLENWEVSLEKSWHSRML
jgi:hypothetical protein